MKPAAAIAAIHSGVPVQHFPFWQKIGIQGLRSIYQAMCVSSAKVLKMFANRWKPRENSDVFEAIYW